MSKVINGIMKSKFVSTLVGRMPKTRDELKAGLPVENIEDLVNPMIDYMLDRSYLESLSDTDKFLYQGTIVKDSVVWVKLVRLPIRPGDCVTTELLERWQRVLAAFHSWDSKVIFNLQRHNGETSLYVGVSSPGGTDVAKSQISTALINSFPGITMEPVEGGEDEDFQDRLCSCGAITGIPSFRKGLPFSQTLDQLAFGIRDQYGKDVDFSLVVVADPIDDLEITEMIGRYLKCGSDIHTEVLRRVTDTDSGSVSSGTSVGLGIGAILQTLGVIT